MRLLTAAGALAIALALASCAAPVAVPAPEPSTIVLSTTTPSPEVQQPMPTLATEGYPVELTVTLDHRVRLGDALQVGHDLGLDVVGYEWANGSAAGGNHIGDKSVDDLLSEFHQRHGTEPEVVKLVVSVLVEDPLDPTSYPRFPLLITGATTDFAAPAG